jgi:amino acid transporter
VGLPLPSIFLDVPISSAVNISLLAPLQSIWLTMIILRGTNMSTAFGNIVATANVVMIIIFITVGLMNSDTSNWTDDWCPNGAAGVLSGTSVIFYAFNGFDAVGTLAEEIPNPEKLVPRGLLGALGIVTVAYIGIGFALTGMVPYAELDDVAPFAHAFVVKGISWAFYMITFSAVLNCWASSFASIMAQPRLLYAVAKDGLLPPMFKKIDSFTKTPRRGTIFVGGLTAFCSGFLDFSTLSMTVSCGILFVYVFVAVGLLRVRYSSMLVTHERDEAIFNIALPAYTGGTFIGSFACHQGYYVVGGVFIAVVLASVLAFMYIRMRHGSGSTAGAQFLCPGIPLVPLVSIAANTHVALSLGLGPLLNVVVYVLVCSLMYLFYGASHSNLGRRQIPLERPLLSNSSKRA